jgi:hypothetical protein
MAANRQHAEEQEPIAAVVVLLLQVPGEVADDAGADGGHVGRVGDH